MNDRLVKWLWHLPATQTFRVQFPARAMIFFYGICMFIVHQSSDFMYQFINMQQLFQQSTIGVVVLTPASHLEEWGSYPM